MLDECTSALIVVAAADVERKVNAVITRAKKQAKAELQANFDDLKHEIDAAHRGNSESLPA